MCARRARGIKCSTKKMPWRSELDAKLALADIARRDNRINGHMETRAYRCPMCHYWHLTSQPLVSAANRMGEN